MSMRAIGTKRLSSLVRGAVAVFAASAAVLAIGAGPAQATIQSVDYFPWGGVTVSTVVDFRASTSTLRSFEYLSYVETVKGATGADACVVTGWATMSAGATTWETPRVQQSCTDAVKFPGDQQRIPDFFYTQTSADTAIPHICITLRWDTGDSRQKCYAGTAVRP